MADLAERIFVERENARIMPEESITMQSLLTVGTSAGGRQPKAIIAIKEKQERYEAVKLQLWKDMTIIFSNLVTPNIVRQN